MKNHYAVFLTLVTLVVLPLVSSPAQGTSEDSISLGPITNISNGIHNAENPQITKLDDAIYVAWSSQIQKENPDGGDERYERVFMARSQDGGKTFGDAITISEKNDLVATKINLVPTSNGDMYVFWGSKKSLVVYEASSEPKDKDVKNHEDSRTDDDNAIQGYCNEKPWYNIINLCNKINMGSKYSIATSDNNVYRIWDQRVTDHTTDLFFDKSDDYGKTFSTPVQITSYHKTHLEPNGYPTINYYTIAAHKDNVYVMWNDYSPYLQQRLWINSSDDNGDTFNAEPFLVGIQDANTVGGFDDMSLIPSEDGRLFLNWRVKDPYTGKFTIFLQKSTDGKIFRDVVQISDPEKSSDTPRLGIVKDNVYAVWEDHTHGEPEVLFRTGADFYTRQEFDDTINLSNSDGESRPRLLLAGNSNVYVIWTENNYYPTTNNQATLLAASSNSGKEFSVPVDISENRSWHYGNVSGMVDDSGQLHLVWHGNQNGKNSDILFRTITLGGNAVTSASKEKPDSGNNIISCKPHLVAVTRSSDASLSCLRPESIPKLIERNWADSVYLDQTFDVTDIEHSIRYAASGSAAITGIVNDPDVVSLTVTMDAASAAGNLVIELPRNLIDAKPGYCGADNSANDDGEFFVLRDSEEINFDEIITTTEKRTLVIPFQKDSKEIEIVVPCLI